MSWLDRLKALPPEDCGLPGHRQNRHNPGFVSLGSVQVAGILANGAGDASAVEQDEAAREAFEARAAIMECDGGLSWAEAARQAMMILTPCARTFPGQPRRCCFYDPRPCDPDTREGLERWPELTWQIRLTDPMHKDGGRGDA